MNHPFYGVYPIIYAFFDAQDQLDREAMRKQVEGCIRGGAHGIAALGIATEVSKLSEAERHRVMEWVAEDVAGRKPLAFTVYGNSVAQQVEYVRAAKALGADWVILQPPPSKGLAESETIRFFGAVMDHSELPVAIQNAPEYLGVGLSADGLGTLRRNHANFTLLKGEGPALTIKRWIEATNRELAVFNGRGGLELPDNLRAGCAGMIPAPECFDRQVEIYELMRQGQEEQAEAIYRDILPLIVFMMQSIETFLCYGKRITAKRLGIEKVYDRAPALPPTEFGLACAERYAARLGTYGDLS